MRRTHLVLLSTLLLAACGGSHKPAVAPKIEASRGSGWHGGQAGLADPVGRPTRLDATMTT